MEEDSKSPNVEDYERSPLLFSSDDEDKEITCEDATVSSPTEHSCEQNSVASELPKSSPFDLAVVREKNRLSQLQELLQGVPPPPSVTIPQMDCTEVLSRWRQNKVLLEEAIKDKAGQGMCNQKDALTEAEVKKVKWPEAKCTQFYDIYYNLNYCSEEYDRLTQKLRERFVGSETSTWCNAIGTDLTGSAKKRQRMRNWGHVSPGSRLSHLARRRQTFSSAGLQQLTSASNDPKAGSSGPIFRRSAAGLSERRCIVLDARKANNKRTTRASAKKRVPSATKTKAIPEMKPAVQATKRALFQSPEEQLRPTVAAFVPAPSDGIENKASRSKRALWPSGCDAEGSRNVNGKRLLDSDFAAVCQASKIARSDASSVRSTRSLSQPVDAQTLDSTETSNQRSLRSGPANRVSEMSELHKRKLIWAVSQALRTEGISSKHPDFRPCATALALHYDQVRREWTGPPPASTSEHMLQVVSARVVEVVQSHRHSDASSETLNRLGEPPFRDSTSSLNVRPSSLSNSNYLSNRRVPSARKSLTFESFDDSSSKSTKSSDVQPKDIKSDVDASCDDLRTNAKRVSRTLFGAENDGKKSTSSERSTDESCSSGKTLQGFDNSSTLGRKRLKRWPDTSPVEKKVMRRRWNSSHKNECLPMPSSTVTSTSDLPSSSQSDSGGLVSGPASGETGSGEPGFVPVDASTVVEGSASEVVPSPKGKVMTPILEAIAVDLSTSSKSKDGGVANGDLSFSGRIQSLKPVEEEKENNAVMDFGLATAPPACLLDLKDEEGKEQDLTRWAEMATRSIKKDSTCLAESRLAASQPSAIAEESMYPWVDPSLLNPADSQCPTKLYDKYKSIFDSSSQEGNS